jgi:predicted RNase H-like nuclease (RuvC/YqgF family)
MSFKFDKIVNSPKKNKRYRVFLDDNSFYDFGLKNPTYGTYIDHHDKTIRDNYRKRHYAQEKHLIELKSLREQLEESEKILNRQNYKISRLEDQVKKYEAEIERLSNQKWYQKLVGFNSK